MNDSPTNLPDEPAKPDPNADKPLNEAKDVKSEGKAQDKSGEDHKISNPEDTDNPAKPSEGEAEPYEAILKQLNAQHKANLKGSADGGELLPKLFGKQIKVAGKKHRIENVVGGNQIHYHGKVGDESAVPKPFPITKDEIDTKRGHYISPSIDLDAQAQEILSAQNVLILCGEALSGKFTAAVYHCITRLAEYTKEPEVFCFNASVTLEYLVNYQYFSKQGYIVNTLVDEHVINLRMRELDNLRGKLRPHGTHLIITVDKPDLVKKELFNTYAVRWKMPDLRLILKAALTRVLSVEPEEALLDMPVVKAVLKNVRKIETVDKVAERIKRFVCHEVESLDDALAEFLITPRQQIEVWFKVHPDVQQATFRMAIAVFGNGAVNRVEEASHRLQYLMERSGEETKKDGEVKPAPFALPTLTERIADAGAHRVKVYKRSDFGFNLTDCIELDDADLWKENLLFVWDEYPRFHSALMIWLRDLATWADFEVRNRATEAVGELITRDIDDVCNDVLHYWMRKLDFKYAGDNIITAFCTAASQPDYTDLVRKRLEFWSRHSNDPYLWLMAAYVYKDVGRFFPGSAVQCLLTIASLDQQTDDQQDKDVEEDDFWFNLGCSSILELLFNHGERDDCALTMLQELRRYAEATKEKVFSSLSLRMFQFLTGFVTSHEISQSGSKEDKQIAANAENWPPTLLWLIGECRECQKAVAGLFRCALRNKETKGFARETLAEWLRFVDKIVDHVRRTPGADKAYRNRLYVAIAGILYDIACEGTVTERKDVLYYLALWRDNGCMITAPRIISAIETDCR